MRSVRLGSEIEKLLAAASKKTGLNASEIVREAVRERCAQVLGQRLDIVLADMIGAVSSGGGSSRNLSRQFADSLLKEHDAQAKRRRRRSA